MKSRTDLKYVPHDPPGESVVKKAVLPCLASVLAVCAPGLGQEPGQWRSCTACQPIATQTSARGLHWALSCFPCFSCPDDYCPNPYPPPCPSSYPAYYRCVPAGDCANCGGPRNNTLTLWFLPTPRALREALWFQP